MDAFNHLNNTVCFRTMEQARIEWLEAFSARTGGGNPDEGPVNVNASCDFPVPLVYPGAIEVRTFPGKPGRSSIGTYYEILRGERTFAQGAAKVEWNSRAIGRPVPLPAGSVPSHFAGDDRQGARLPWP